MTVLNIAARTISNAFFKDDFKKICEKYYYYKKVNIPEILVTALVLAEDKRFWNHTGVDIRAVIRSLFQTIIYGKIQGGSTLEQQLCRTITARYEFSILRKIREIILALAVQEIIPKIEIPRFYLSIAYFGWKMTGLVNACKKMNIKLSRLNENDAASIIARLKVPEPMICSKEKNQRIQRRIEFIRGKLLRYINAEEKINEPILKCVGNELEEIKCSLIKNKKILFSFSANTRMEKENILSSEDVYGTNGKLPPGIYELTSSKNINSIFISNIGRAGIIITSKGKIRNGLQIHPGEKHSKGCLVLSGKNSKRTCSELNDYVRETRAGRINMLMKYELS